VAKPKKKRTVKQYVEAILRKYEDARNDDKILQLLYWKLVDKIDFNNFPSEYVRKATPSESITRARRIIQEEGKYLPSDEVSEVRRNREMSMRRNIINNREVV
jgi:hypothetical protein